MRSTISRLPARLAAVFRKLRSDAGTAVVEYAMLVVLVALICITAVTFLGSSTCENLSEVPEQAFGTGNNAQC